MTLTSEDLVDQYERVERMAHIGSWRWNPATEELWWSPGMHAIFGIAPDQFDGKMTTLFNAALPEDRPILTEAAKRYEQTGVPERLAYRIQRSDGSVRHVWAFGESIGGHGDPAIAIGYVLDVTDRVKTEDRLRDEIRLAGTRAEERFRAVVLSAPLPVMLFADDGEVLMVNRRWTEMTGYRLDEIPTLDEWTKKAYGKHAAEVRRGIQQLFELDGATDEGEFEIRTKSGERRRWLFSSAPQVALADGRRVMASMARDVTAERALQAERRAYEDHLHREQKTTSLGVLAGGIAHDFNNLLVGVLGNLSLIEARLEGDPALAQLLQNMRSATEQAAALSRDMLTYAGEQEPDRVALRVDDDIDQMRALLHTAASHRYVVDYQLHAGDAATMLGHNQLSQVLINLVSNAADAMDGSDGRIAIRSGLEVLDEDTLSNRVLGSAATPGEFVFAEVEDNGAGMDEQRQARVFEPFYTAKPGGRGLGMAVVMGVARTAHGVIELDSRVGRGTRVRVSFPRTTALPSTTTVAEGDSAEERNAGGRLLVVDDQPIVRSALASMLTFLGYDVVEASGGDEAIAISAREPGLRGAIVDLTMPGMSGIEVLHELKQQRPDLIVVLTTGYTDRELPDESAAIRHDGVLAKPFSVDDLSTLMTNVLR